MLGGTRVGMAGLIAALAACWLLVAAGPATAATDSDRDGLPDRWELGHGPNAKLNLKKLGADPDRRDVFIEVDFARNVSPDSVGCGALNDLRAAYAKAPLKNRDGSKGITLHIDAGRRCGKRNYDLGGSSRFRPGVGCSTPLDSSKAMKPSRYNAFHNIAVVEAICGGSAGIAHTTNAMVSSSYDFAHVTMHELGHVFGLDHGPLTSFSVMSQQLVPVAGSLDTYFSVGPGGDIYDYNRHPVKAVDETALSEVNGYQSNPAGEKYLAKIFGHQYCPSGGPSGYSYNAIGPAGHHMDWNCSSTSAFFPPFSQFINPGTIQYDVDGSGDLNTIPGTPAEWPKLGLGNGRIGG